MILSTATRCHLIKKTIQPMILSSMTQQFHTSNSSKDTHDYAAVDLVVPQNKHNAIVSNQSILKKARAISGAVVRWKKVDGTMVVDEDPVLVVGRPFQVKAATEYILNGSVDKDESDTDTSHKLIWHGYKRNFKGQFPPEKPRKTCIRCGGHRISGNPCPLCQLQIKSHYNVHFTDIEILEQFICPHTWEILSPKVTGICKKQYQRVVEAVQKARDHGLLPFTLPLHSKEQGKHKPAGVPTDKKIKVKMH